MIAELRVVVEQEEPSQVEHCARDVLLLGQELLDNSLKDTILLIPGQVEFYDWFQHIAQILTKLPPICLQIHRQDGLSVRLKLEVAIPSLGLHQEPGRLPDLTLLRVVVHVVKLVQFGLPPGDVETVRPDVRPERGGESSARQEQLDLLGRGLVQESLLQL